MVLYKELSYQIVGCCIQVHKELGCGLLEQCYHNALYFELKEAGFHVRYNAPYEVKYKGNTVGEYLADLVVEGKIILELKSVRQLAEAHHAQLINYLRISGCRVGYLLNFQNCRLEFQRFVPSVLLYSEIPGKAQWCEGNHISKFGPFMSPLSRF